MFGTILKSWQAYAAMSIQCQFHLMNTSIISLMPDTKSKNKVRLGGGGKIKVFLWQHINCKQFLRTLAALKAHLDICL